MRVLLLAAPVAALLLAAGCAPEPFVTALPAAHIAPTQATPSTEPSVAMGSTVEFSSSNAEVAAQGAAYEPTNGWVETPIEDIAFSEAHRLDAVSPSFRSFVEESMSSTDTDGCTVLGISVMSTHPDGFVLGSVSTDCGGGQAIWSEHLTDPHKGWSLEMMLQSAPACADLKAIGLPAGVGLVCSEAAGHYSEF